MASDPRTLARGLRAIAQQPTGAVGMPGALTPQEAGGGMMQPAQAPDVQKWARGLRAMSQAAGGPLVKRMEARGQRQDQRFASGERAPSPATGEDIDVADSLAGSLMGTIKAYHGSPHRFDKFSLDKIGTGEGAQAYGHGLYFAESPDVAAGYQARLADIDDGPPAFFRNAEGNAIDEAPGNVWLLRGDDTQTGYDELLKRAENKVEWAAKLKNKQIAQIEQRKATEALDWLKANPGANFAPNEMRGAFYTTNLNVEPEDLLDWDLPLSQQSEKVRAALEGVKEDALKQYRRSLTQEAAPSPSQMPDDIDELMAALGDLDDTAGTLAAMDRRDAERVDKAVDAMRQRLEQRGGAVLYRELSEIFGSPAKFSEELRSRGIPGIRYLDQGSRATGDGTRNFVIFDDSLVDITHVDGKPLTKAERKEAVAAMMAGGIGAMGVASMTGDGNGGT